MNCPACGFENPEGIRFCGSCAQPLQAASTCPACGFANPAGFRFCGECARPLSSALQPARPEREPRSYTPKHLADKILQSKSALEGERKQVTVLFADVKGSTELAQSLDPEAWYGISDRFLQILAEGVHRFEGTVNQFTGDGIMALFGAPIAHEDHAQRACYAALHLRDELKRYGDEVKRTKGVTLAFRMGLHSGEVVVGKIGDDLRMDYTAAGFTTNLADRMQKLADPGTVYLSESTRRLVEGYFELRDLGVFELSGVSEPTHVYELQGAGPLRTRLDVSRSRGFSRFVGREHETLVLEHALAQAEAGNGQVVGVVGEAGVGKSRLCSEFVERCGLRGTTVYQAHCPAHGKTVPFLPLLELLRSYFGISDRDADQLAREKITGRLLLIEEGFRDLLPVLFEFLGVPDPERPVPPMDPQARQRQLFGFVRRLVQARAERAVVVILMDDLHWVDPGTDAFLGQFVEATPETRTMLLVNFRPEYQAAWMGKSYCQQLPLLPLGPEAIEELLADLLGRDTSAVELPALIRARTGGTPFFIEEVVRGLVESGHLEGQPGAYRLARPVEEVEIPPTVHAVLAARIDRLEEREKQVLQTAAVIGPRFTEPILRRVIELPADELSAALQVLQAGEFLFEASLYPEVEYAFRHPLTLEVALGSQLSDRRARLHAAVARALEESEPERVEERAALVAHHWEQAGETLEAGRWHARAARWAGLHNPGEALRHWRQAWELLRDHRDSAEARGLVLMAGIWLLRFGWRVGLSDGEAAEVFAEGRELAKQSGDLRSEAALVSSFTAQCSMRGDFEAARQYATLAEQLAKQVGDPKLLIGLAPDWIFVYQDAFDSQRGLRATEEVLEVVRANPGIARRGPRAASYAFLENSRGILLRNLGRWKEAREAAARALELAQQSDAKEALVWAHEGGARDAVASGDRERALYHARASLEVADELGSPYVRLVGLSAVAFTARCFEDWDGYLQAAQEQLAVAREHQTGLIGEGYWVAEVARAQLERGEIPEARRHAEEALELARRRGARYYELAAIVVMAQVLLCSEGLGAQQRIEQLLEEAEALGGELLNVSLRSDVHLARAELARLRDDDEERERQLREAHRSAKEMGNLLVARRLEREHDLGEPA